MVACTSIVLWLFVTKSHLKLSGSWCIYLTGCSWLESSFHYENMLYVMYWFVTIKRNKFIIASKWCLCINTLTTGPKWILASPSVNDKLTRLWQFNVLRFCGLSWATFLLATSIFLQVILSFRCLMFLYEILWPIDFADLSTLLYISGVPM